MNTLFGKPVGYNLDSNILQFELSFIDDATIEFVDKIISEEKFFDVKILDSHVKEPPENKHYRKWFADLTAIIRYEKRKYNEGERVSRKELYAFHYEVKKQILPVDRVKVGKREIVLPPSLTTLTIGEVVKSIQDLEDMYRQLYPDIRFER